MLEMREAEHDREGECKRKEKQLEEGSSSDKRRSETKTHAEWEGWLVVLDTRDQGRDSDDDEVKRKIKRRTKATARADRRRVKGSSRTFSGRGVRS